MTLLKLLGYTLNNAGRTSGSTVRFTNESKSSDIIFHKPHPGNIVKEYIIRQIIDKLKKEELL